MDKDVERIKQIIDEVKVNFTKYGGDVEFLRIEGGDVVKIKPTGYCHR